MKRTSVLMFISGTMLLAAGCASKATITGTVSYKGKPIPSGNITFTPESGAPLVNAPIREGKYSAENVPTGNAKVSIMSMYMASRPSPMMDPSKKDKMAPPKDAPPEAQKAFQQSTQSKQGIKIPEKYTDPEQSGLSYTVTSGKQTKDFNLD